MQQPKKEPNGEGEEREGEEDGKAIFLGERGDNKNAQEFPNHIAENLGPIQKQLGVSEAKEGFLIFPSGTCPRFSEAIHSKVGEKGAKSSVD